MARILQWLKGLSCAKCVFMDVVAAVKGLVSSVCKIVVLSSCTGCQQHPAAICVTVVTGDKVGCQISS